MTPLHSGVYNNAPGEVILAVVGVFPDVAKEENRDGDIALHTGIKRTVSVFFKKDYCARVRYASTHL
jgi:hypothetical protein